MLPESESGKFDHSQVKVKPPVERARAQRQLAHEVHGHDEEEDQPERPGAEQPVGDRGGGVQAHRIATSAGDHVLEGLGDLCRPRRRASRLGRAVLL